MAKEATKIVLEQILGLYETGTLYIDRLKDPNSDCQVDIRVGNTTYMDCRELIQHFRDKTQMLAYTTTELIANDGQYYYLQIKNYSKDKTLQTQQDHYIIIKRNSCINTTARSW